MKRANSFVITAALAIPGLVFAADEEPQLCAEAAHEVTGETRYELESSRPVLFGKDQYELTLVAQDTGTRVVCKVRNGRITTLRINLQDTEGGLALLD